MCSLSHYIVKHMLTEFVPACCFKQIKSSKYSTNDFFLFSKNGIRIFYLTLIWVLRVPLVHQAGLKLRPSATWTFLITKHTFVSNINCSLCKYLTFDKMPLRVYVCIHACMYVHACMHVCRPIYVYTHNKHYMIYIQQHARTQLQSFLRDQWTQARIPGCECPSEDNTLLPVVMCWTISASLCL